MKLKKFFLLLIIALMLPYGCAKQTTPIKSNYYPACYEPLAYLHNRTNGTGKAIGAGAIQGGVITGLAAAIAGSIGGSLRPAGMLGSVAAGTVVGGMVGGVSKHENISKEDNKHLTKYLEEIDGDITDMDITTAAATASKQCYSRSLKTLVHEMKDGHISKDAAKERFEEILAGTKEASEILGTPSDTQEMIQDFQKAQK